MLTPYDRDYDYLDLEDDSDPEKAESSDDDIDILLFGTPEQKRKLYKRSKGDKSSSEDDFEKEMNAELKRKVKAIETRRRQLSIGCITLDDDVKPGTSGVASPNKDGSTEEPQKYYDDVYFDSDEEDMVAQGDARKKKNPILSNDELLYDPDLDDEDQHWVDQQKQSYRVKQPAGKGEDQGKVKPVPSSDAVLNCPACMTTLCLDCQRYDYSCEQAGNTHKSRDESQTESETSNEESDSTMLEQKKENLTPPGNFLKAETSERLMTIKLGHKIVDFDFSPFVRVWSKASKKRIRKHETYTNQYRAMFVMNCVVDNTERLKFPKGNAKERRRKRKKQMSDSSNAKTAADEDEDWFHPVKCSECSTVVAVCDDDEVYHFFNVLASYA